MSIDIVGFGGLLLSLFFYVAFLSFKFGMLHTDLKNLQDRVGNIERQGEKFNSNLDVIIRLEERIINLEKKIEFLFKKIVGGRDL